MVSPTSSPGARSARQFEGFVYVDGQLGREPGRYQVPSLKRKWKMFLNGGELCSGFGYRRGAWRKEAASGAGRWKRPPAEG